MWLNSCLQLSLKFSLLLCAPHLSLCPSDSVLREPFVFSFSRAERPAYSCLRIRTKFTIATSSAGRAGEPESPHLSVSKVIIYLSNPLSLSSPDTQREGGGEADERRSFDAPACVIVSIFQWQRCVKWKLDRAGCTQTGNFILTSWGKEGAETQRRCSRWEGKGGFAEWLCAHMDWINPSPI